MFQFDSVHASIYYICIRTRTVKILQAMSLLLHSGSLSLSPSLSAFLIIQNLSQYVINMWSLTVNAQHHTWYISQYTFVGASLFGCIHPLIVFWSVPTYHFERKLVSDMKRKRNMFICLGHWWIERFLYMSAKYMRVYHESWLWEFTMRVDSVRVYHGSWFCETLPFGLIVRVYHESWLWVYHESWFCKSLPWELTVRVYHERADCEFTMRVDCIRVYHESSLWEFTMRVDC